MQFAVEHLEFKSQDEASTIRQVAALLPDVLADHGDITIAGVTVGSYEVEEGVLVRESKPRKPREKKTT